MQGEDAQVVPTHARKGKNFNQEEECQLCPSFLAISQNPCTSIAQQVGAFGSVLARF
jgi:hypothetical protein